MRIHILDIDHPSQKIIAQACIKFTDLQNKAIFTYRKDPNIDIYVGKEDNLYQRDLNPNRVSAIVKYLRKAILNNKENMLSVIFPTAMLLSCNYDEGNIVAAKNEDVNIIMPSDFFIVDGQHRLGSMKKLYKSVLGSLNNDEDMKIKSANHP